MIRPSATLPLLHDSNGSHFNTHSKRKCLGGTQGHEGTAAAAAAAAAVTTAAHACCNASTAGMMAVPLTIPTAIASSSSMMAPSRAEHDRARHRHRRRPRSSRRPWQQLPPTLLPLLHSVALLLVLCILTSPATAASIDFNNCMDLTIINSNPVQLQFIPLVFEAFFDTDDASHNLNVTVYGNVSGSATVTLPPPPSDPKWKNPNETVGKIVDLSLPNNKYSTLFAKYNVLTYTPYNMAPTRFCQSLIGSDKCPLGPAFDASRDDTSQLPGFTVAHQLYSSYSFTTISATLRVTSGDASNAVLACVSANITPRLGEALTSLLRFMPLVILSLVGLGTAFAAVMSPWGTVDVFKWTSNYGRDADLLRLVTPGFGDCLQYIQFAVLTGGLSLSYPGYFQPVVSQASWSTLMFNTSFVSRGGGTQSLVDGIYVTHGGYGMDRLSQLIGMTSVKDIWAGMIIWLLVIIAGAIACIQFGFFVRWLYRSLSHTQEEDLRAKNLPFTVGNIVRIVFNYFLLPTIALSMFQLVVAGVPPIAPYTTALAALLLVTLIGFAAWLLRLVATVRPRSYLFDDLPTVLLYGPLYNTYSDNAAPFALIPMFLQLIRGIAIGAVQHSGIAQLVLLAICEVILILTLHAFRPFHSTTSNNAYHTFFAIVRLLTTLLSVAFVPSLGVSEAPKGWIGYVILLMHAIVLVFGFFLNAIQTIIEVAARLAGAGGEGGVGGGAARGGLVKVFGMRQLSRRVPRRLGRDSGISDSDLLTPNGDRKAHLEAGRARSASGSSAVLLNRHETSDGRASTGMGSNSPFGYNDRPRSGSACTPTTPGAQSTFSYLPGGPAGSGTGGIAGVRTVDTTDPYYRPPRRRPTMENSPGAQSPGSWTSADWANKRWSQNSAGGGSNIAAADPLDGPSISGRATPVPAYLASRELSDQNINDNHRSPTDYAVREVDFYYGVRGPALSNLPTRRLGTGPADPTGPVASAAGWLKGWFGGKTKEKGKGFEVVRSSRMPPPMAPGPSAARSLADAEPAPAQSHAMQDINLDASKREADVNPADIGMALPLGAGPTNQREAEYVSDEDDFDEDDEENFRTSRLSDFPPSLPGIEPVGGIELPSRIGSKASSRHSMVGARGGSPHVPRKSSKRQSVPAAGHAGLGDASKRLPAILASPPISPGINSDRLYDPHQPPRPTSEASFRFPFDGPSTGEASRTSTRGAESIASSSGGPTAADEEERGPSGSHARHSSSALGNLGADTMRDRPTSMGYVQQHRASDNIHSVVPGSQHDLHLAGSTAEVLDSTHRSRTGSHDSRSTGR